MPCTLFDSRFFVSSFRHNLTPTCCDLSWFHLRRRRWTWRPIFQKPIKEYESSRRRKSNVRVTLELMSLSRSTSRARAHIITCDAPLTHALWRAHVETRFRFFRMCRRRVERRRSGATEGRPKRNGAKTRRSHQNFRNGKSISNWLGNVRRRHRDAEESPPGSDKEKCALFRLHYGSGQPDAGIF